MDVGRRVLYDSSTGEIIDILGEMSGSDVTARPTWNGCTYLDIPYGQNEDEFSLLKKAHVDITNKVVVFDELNPKTVDQDTRLKVLTQSLFTINQAFVGQNGVAEALQKILAALNSVEGGK